MGGDALSIKRLTVHYGRRVAVDDLTLSLRPGEIVALLGPNGAGKSTALLAVAGGLVPTDGEICVGALNVATQPLEARAQIGFADQPPTLYDFFSVEEHLSFIGESRGGSGTDAHGALLAELGLASIAGRLGRELSFGMRQRVGLAAALVGKPSVVLLDETLNGLDPRAAKQARDVLAAAAQDGVAILMSTHLLGIAERLCHRIVIMDQGRLRADVCGGELEELLAKGPGAIEELYLSLVDDPDGEA